MVELFFWKTLLAVVFVCAFAAAVVITEDAMSEHRSLRIRSLPARVSYSFVLVLILFLLFFGDAVVTG